MTLRFVADKSALARLGHASVASRLAGSIMRGEVATCGMIELEVLYSARTPKDLHETREERGRAFHRIAMSETDFQRAEDVMMSLADSGRHRAVSLPDLLIAAVAERAGLVVLHYDADFDTIASVTGQPVEWVVTKGSI